MRYLIKVCIIVIIVISFIYYKIFRIDFNISVLIIFYCIDIEFSFVLVLIIYEVLLNSNINLKKKLVLY